MMVSVRDIQCAVRAYRSRAGFKRRVQPARLDFLSLTMATQQKQKQKQKQAITLKGSCALVTEFFKYSVNT